ncbi:hypothetical protein F4780DRAFT_785613 [Xylariomycetidae sp. FL0641]|nr:hypothetical protein F4780DRAFT_785613 [Xylariomycetidae sp. FL0641]
MDSYSYMPPPDGRLHRVPNATSNLYQTNDLHCHETPVAIARTGRLGRLGHRQPVASPSQQGNVVRTGFQPQQLQPFPGQQGNLSPYAQARDHSRPLPQASHNQPHLFNQQQDRPLAGHPPHQQHHQLPGQQVNVPISSYPQPAYDGQQMLPVPVGQAYLKNQQRYMATAAHQSQQQQPFPGQPGNHHQFGNSSFPEFYDSTRRMGATGFLSQEQQQELRQQRHLLQQYRPQLGDHGAMVEYSQPGMTSTASSRRVLVPMAPGMPSYPENTQVSPNGYVPPGMPSGSAPVGSKQGSFSARMAQSNPMVRTTTEPDKKMLVDGTLRECEWKKGWHLVKEKIDGKEESHYMINFSTESRSDHLIHQPYQHDCVSEEPSKVRQKRKHGSKGSESPAVEDSALAPRRDREELTEDLQITEASRAASHQSHNEDLQWSVEKKPAANAVPVQAMAEPPLFGDDGLQRPSEEMPTSNDDPEQAVEEMDFGNEDPLEWYPGGMPAADELPEQGLEEPQFDDSNMQWTPEDTSAESTVPEQAAQFDDEDRCCVPVDWLAAEYVPEQGAGEAQSDNEVLQQSSEGRLAANGVPKQVEENSAPVDNGQRLPELPVVNYFQVPTSPSSGDNSFSFVNEWLASSGQPNGQSQDDRFSSLVDILAADPQPNEQFLDEPLEYAPYDFNSASA